MLAIASLLVTVCSLYNNEKVKSRKLISNQIVIKPATQNTFLRQYAEKTSVHSNVR